MSHLYLKWIQIFSLKLGYTRERNIWFFLNLWVPLFSWVKPQWKFLVFICVVPNPTQTWHLQTSHYHLILAQLCLLPYFPHIPPLLSPCLPSFWPLKPIIIPILILHLQVNTPLNSHLNPPPQIIILVLPRRTDAGTCGILGVNVPAKIEPRHRQLFAKDTYW